MKVLPNVPAATRFLGVAALALGLVGCASMAYSTPEEAVKHRATQRWQAMVAKDFKAAYRYLSPYNRATNSEDTYLREMGGGNAWVATEVVSVTCEQQTCKTRVRVEVLSPMPNKFGGKIATHIDEDWVLVDGEWWYSQR